MVQVAASRHFSLALTDKGEVGAEGGMLAMVTFCPVHVFLFTLTRTFRCMRHLLRGAMISLSGPPRHAPLGEQT